MSRFRPWMLVTLLCLLYIGGVLLANEGDPLSLVTLGTQFSQGDPNGTEGYDGQFGYYIARDPSNAAQYIDVPAYRFQRILMPAVAWLLSLGNAALIPWLFLITGLVSLASGTALFEYLLRREGVSRWYALTYGLTLGTFGAVRLSLPEPLAYALALAGLLLFLRQRWLWSALPFALAALTRETTLLIPAACGLYLLANRRWREAISFGLLTLLPFAAWQAILYAHFGSFGIGSGGAMATGFEIIPFAGILRIFSETPAARWPSLLLVFIPVLLPFVLVPTFWALRCCWRDWRDQAVDLYTWLLLTTGAIMLFVPFSTYREPLGILRFILGLQIAVILYAANRKNARALRYSTIWIVTTLFVFVLLAPASA